MTQHASYIHLVVDKAINFSNEYLRGLQEPIYRAPDNMIDYSKVSPGHEIVFWKAIYANISELAFKVYEEKIGYQLPPTYKDFPSYKYFISLNFGHEVEFFRHTQSWAHDYYGNILKTGVEATLGNGLIPFAQTNDRVILCFDTNDSNKENEYGIVSYVPEFGEKEYPSRQGQYTFIDLIFDCERNLDRWREMKQTSA
ncbi:SMI1/KNR4 family protein [Agriterribacter humi]|uniref:SMI1/KNR4 family protein n=1 Tax=Agriterribacter humi TaxID=1104781 RepID=UPI001264BE58|nr:SMI1/KNR4 family protein [Agriterribacter humi]